MVRKPLTEEQKALKRERDRRYREAHREEINQRARARRATKKAQATSKWGKWWSPEIAKWWPHVAHTWGNDEKEFWDYVGQGRRNGAPVAAIVRTLKLQARASDDYLQGERTVGRDLWAIKDDFDLDDRFFYYHPGK